MSDPFCCVKICTIVVLGADKNWFKKPHLSFLNRIRKYTYTNMYYLGEFESWKSNT